MRKETSANYVNRQFLVSYCRVNTALNIISGRWKALILILISEGSNRFSLLKNKMPNISDQALSKQLKELEKDKLIYREVIPEVPVKVNYHLTPKGEALGPILTDMANWSDM
jgi:DNA-binding HxlR family transcriptional regulator